MDRRGDDVHDDTRTAPGRDRAPAAVQTAGLVKEYRSRAGVVEAVRGVDLRVEAGEVFGFLGPNGAGKSTTVRMVTTLLSITSGTAHVAGVDVAREPDAARRRIGVALRRRGWTRARPGASCSSSRAGCSACRRATRRPARRSFWSSSSSATPPTGASRATRAA
jgi:hypothetical protein